MKKEQRVSDFAFFVSEYIRQHIDPNAQLPVLTDEQISIVVDRIYQRLQEELKKKNSFPV